MVSAEKDIENDHELWLKEIRNCRRIIANRERILTKARNVRSVEYDHLRADNDFSCQQPQTVDFELEKNKSLGIDRNTDRRLKAGKIKIDMKIDFHGLTSGAARELLLHSVVEAYGGGLKCMLVITGRGLNTSHNVATIKSQLEKWMQMPAISSRVIKYVDATQRHGGRGAVYLLLKTNRKNPTSRIKPV
ncbi:MAG: Smr/MutS family protein [Rickettsiales bacterium]|jgi:DNA-nicking Smr family endonuclease|nr:Smr/MutS family protein [Rickettsiales bacterium]